MQTEYFIRFEKNFKNSPSINGPNKDSCGTPYIYIYIYLSEHQFWIFLDRIDFQRSGFVSQKPTAIDVPPPLRRSAQQGAIIQNAIWPTLDCFSQEFPWMKLEDIYIYIYTSPVPYFRELRYAVDKEKMAPLGAFRSKVTRENYSLPLACSEYRGVHFVGRLTIF